MKTSVALQISWLKKSKRKKKDELPRSGSCLAPTANSMGSSRVGRKRRNGDTGGVVDSKNLNDSNPNF